MHLYGTSVQIVASTWLQIDHKSEKRQLRHNFLKWHQHQFFWCCYVSLVMFSYWFRFPVNIMTAFRVMAIFVCKGLTRNLEIGNTLSEFWPISGDWSKLGIPNQQVAWNYCPTPSHPHPLEWWNIWRDDCKNS